MGKITRQRARTRVKANLRKPSPPRPTDLGKEDPMDIGCDAQFKEPTNPPTSSGGMKTMKNPFGNTKIDVSALRTRLTVTPVDDEEDRQSFISKGSLRKGNEQMKKKDKMKLRREKWLEKVDAIQQHRRRRKEKKKRLKTPVVGDLEPMMSALPELSEIIQMSREAGKRADKRRQSLGGRSKKSTLKSKQRQTLLDEERNRFQKVLQHSGFKANPFKTINKHLALKIQQDNASEKP